MKIYTQQQLIFVSLLTFLGSVGCGDELVGLPHFNNSPTSSILTSKELKTSSIDSVLSSRGFDEIDRSVLSMKTHTNTRHIDLSNSDSILVRSHTIGENLNVYKEIQAPLQTPPSSNTSPADEDTAVQLDIEEGELCTYRVEDWAQGCTHSKDIGCVLENFEDLFFENDEFVLGVHDLNVSFENSDVLFNALSTENEADLIGESVLDPKAQEINSLIAQLITFKLNMTLHTSGLKGVVEAENFVVTKGVFDGWTLKAILSVSEEIIGGEHELLTELDLDPSELAHALAQINHAALDCSAPSIIQHP